MTPKRILSDADKARNRRSLVIALGLALFVIMVFVITIVRIGGDVANRTF